MRGLPPTTSHHRIHRPCKLQVPFPIDTVIMADKEVGVRYFHKGIPRTVVGYDKCLQRQQEAELAAASGDLRRAILLLRENLVWCKTNLSVDPMHEMTVWHQEALGTHLAEQGKHTEALVHIADAYDSRYAVSPDGQDTLMTLDQYASVLAKLGKHGLAARKYQEVWEAQKKALGKDNSLTLTTGFELACCWFNHGMSGVDKMLNLRKARDLHKDILWAREQQSPFDLVATAMAREELAQDYFELGNHVEARKLVKKNLDQVRPFRNVRNSSMFTLEEIRSLEQSSQRLLDSINQMERKRQHARENELREKREREERERKQREQREQGERESPDQRPRDKGTGTSDNNRRGGQQNVRRASAQESDGRSNSATDRTEDERAEMERRERERKRTAKEDQERQVRRKRELEIQEQARLRLERQEEEKKREMEQKEWERRQQEKQVQRRREREIREQARLRLENEEREKNRLEEERALARREKDEKFRAMKELASRELAKMRLEQAQEQEAEKQREKEQEEQKQREKEQEEQKQRKKEQEEQKQRGQELQAHGGPEQERAVDHQPHGVQIPETEGTANRDPPGTVTPDRRMTPDKEPEATFPSLPTPTINIVEPPVTTEKQNIITPNRPEEDGKLGLTAENGQSLKGQLSRSVSTSKLPSSTKAKRATSIPVTGEDVQIERRKSDPTINKGAAASAKPASSTRPRNHHDSPYDAIEERFDDRSVHRWFNDVRAINETILDPFRRRAGKRVKIAVLDTGIDLGNTAFKDKEIRKRIKKRVDFVEKDGDATDICGHGTHCVAVLNKVAPWADIYVGRVAVGFEKGPDANIVAEAIRRALGPKGDGDAAENWDVDILSLSLGFNGYNRAIKAALDEVMGRGNAKIVLAAASNSGTLRNMAFPASALEIIAINSATANGIPSSFNPRSAKDEKRLTVLGEAVTSAWTTTVEEPNTGELTTNPNATKRMTGTSVATPIAAGIVALLLEAVMIDVPDEEDTMKILNEVRPWLRGYEGMMAVLMDKAAPTQGGYHNIVPQRLLDPTWPEERRINRIANRLRDILTDHFGDLREGP